MNGLGTGVRLALSGAAALAVAVAAFGVSDESPRIAEARERLERKSQAERDELLEQYEAFKSLPPAEQETLRRLDAAVRSEESLRAALGRYERFVQGLPPWELAALRSQPDPTSKAEKVAAIARERSRQDTPPSPGGRFGDLPVLSGPALDAAMEKLADAVPIPDEERERLKNEPPHVRHLAIAREAKRTFDESQQRRFAGTGPWPDEAALAEIISTFPTEPMRKWHSEVPSDFRRFAVLGLLLRSLIAEWQQLADAAISREELRKAIGELPEDERDRLAQRSSEELIRQAIIQRIAEREDGAGRVARGLRDAVQLSREFFPDRFRGGRPGGDGRGPGGRGPGGDRGPRDGDGPPRDRPPFRRPGDDRPPPPPERGEP